MSEKEWVVQAVPGGWRVVNRLNPEEAVRDPEKAWGVTIFATEAEANAMAAVLRAGGA